MQRLTLVKGLRTIEGQVPDEATIYSLPDSKRSAEKGGRKNVRAGIYVMDLAWLLHA